MGRSKPPKGISSGAELFNARQRIDELERMLEEAEGELSRARCECDMKQWILDAQAKKAAVILELSSGASLEEIRTTLARAKLLPRFVPSPEQERTFIDWQGSKRKLWKHTMLCSYLDIETGAEIDSSEWTAEVRDMGARSMSNLYKSCVRQFLTMTLLLDPRSNVSGSPEARAANEKEEEGEQSPSACPPPRGRAGAEQKPEYTFGIDCMGRHYHTIGEVPPLPDLDDDNGED